MFLHDVQKRLALLFLFGRRLLKPLADKAVLQVGYQQHRHQQRQPQGNDDGPGERQDKVFEHSFERKEERNESDADGKGRAQNGDKEFLGAACRRLPTGNSLVQAFHIAVNDHHRIIHNHPQGNDQGRQGNRVEFDAAKEKHAQTHKDGDGNRNGRNHRHAQGHQQHDHQHHRQDGDEQFA